jgi:hypothetical protein
VKKLALVAVMAIAVLILGTSACNSAKGTNATTPTVEKQAPVVKAPSPQPDTNGSINISGIRDGIGYSYWQRPGSCRELTLKFPGDSSYVLYDEDDNNRIGDRGDYIKVIHHDQLAVVYFDGGGNDIPGDWSYQMPSKKRATQVFQAWRPWIIQAYLEQHS